MPAVSDRGRQCFKVEEKTYSPLPGVQVLSPHRILGLLKYLWFVIPEQSEGVGGVRPTANPWWNERPRASWCGWYYDPSKGPQYRWICIPWSTCPLKKKIIFYKVKNCSDSLVAPSLDYFSQCYFKIEPFAAYFSLTCRGMFCGSNRRDKESLLLFSSVFLQPIPHCPWDQL